MSNFTLLTINADVRRREILWRNAVIRKRYQQADDLSGKRRRLPSPRGINWSRGSPVKEAHPPVGWVGEGDPAIFSLTATRTLNIYFSSTRTLRSTRKRAKSGEQISRMQRRRPRRQRSVARFESARANCANRGRKSARAEIRGGAGK